MQKNLLLLLAFLLIVPVALIKPNYSDARSAGVSANSAIVKSLKSPTKYELRYKKAISLLQSNYLYRDKAAQLEAWRNRFDGKLSTRKDLVAALENVCQSFKDDYTYVLAESDLKERHDEQEEKQVVQWKRLSSDIGYVKLKSFASKHAVAEMRKAFKQLQSCQGYVLDLRGNHGGFIEVAYDIFSMLVDQGDFMSYVGIAENMPDFQTFTVTPTAAKVIQNGSEISRKREHNLIRNKGLLVLINENTRSAAEMLAGALRDNGRAAIIGKQSYGKGVLQDVFDIDDRTSLKVVTARYYLPGGRSIHNLGLVPDYQIVEEDQQLSKSVAYLNNLIARAKGNGGTLARIPSQLPSL